MKKYKLFYLFIPFLTFVFILAIEIISLILNIKQIKTTGKKLAIDIIKNQPKNFDNNFSDWQKQTIKLTNKIHRLAFVKKILPKKYYQQINQAKGLLDTISELNHCLPKILGKDKSKTYFILLQNNLELRPSGGFMGSYAKIKFKNGAMEKLTINDIYVPDGQLSGHVDPPWPIQTAFKQGWWKLRDSNWKPDFPESAKQIQWFFSKGNEEQSNGIIAINFLVVKDLLKIIGPLKIPDYNYDINADNFYQITQNEVENNFFPGSTQKKDFLGAVAKYLILKLEETKDKQLIQLIKVVKDNLDEKQILIAFNDFQLNQFFCQLNWNGEIKRKHKDSKDILADYVYIIDTNLGANKANCCVQRRVFQEINFNKNGFIKEKLEINYRNDSPKKRPKPPLFWGGIYKNFLRIILPFETENIKIKINGKLLKNKIEIKNYPNKKLKSVGFFVITPPLSQSAVEISYEKKASLINSQKYYLEIQKQPGIENYPHLLRIKAPKKDLVLDKNIKTDEIIKIDL